MDSQLTKTDSQLTKTDSQLTKMDSQLTKMDSQYYQDILTYLCKYDILFVGDFMATIKNNYLVKKKNVLNEIRANNMTLQELRLFSIYLSKINSNDVTTRVVRFSLSDFQAIMELGKIKIDYMKHVTNSLLSKIVNLPIETDDGVFIGYEGFQLFKECKVVMNTNGDWFIEIDAHDKALPLMFQFKHKFFSYQLWNALCLKSSNQLRMYEILKQYEKIGARVISIEHLKESIGIEKNEYFRFNDFKKWVLDACQQALAVNTDIKFTYEPYGKKGKGGKILFLKFTIQKNTGYVDKITLDEFISRNKKKEEEEKRSSPFDEKMKFLAEACGNEFSIKEIIVLHDLMLEKLPHETVEDELESYNYLMHKYRYMNMRAEKHPIQHRFSYMRSIIGKE